MIAKKFLTLALAAAAGCALAWDGNLQLFHRGEGHEPQAIAGTTTAGVRFAVENAIKGVSACCPSYNNSRGGLTFSLYPWAGSVVASRARGAIATKRFEDFEDNQTLELSFAKQPAGVYYAELSRGTERVGVWKAKQGRQGVESFLDGCPVGGVFEFGVTMTGLKIPFLGDPALYGLLSAPGECPPPTKGVSDADGNLVPGRTFEERDLYADTWDAMDELGRRLGGSAQHPAPRPRQVGIFYWIWHQGWHTSAGPWNNAKILASDPSLHHRPGDPKWGPIGYPHHWDEPLLGYYRTTDSWVSRRHAQLLAEAGVDVVVFDATNGNRTWMESFWTLAKTWSAMRRDGVKTPQFAYMLPFGEQPVQAESMLQLYRDVYRPGKYRDLWYYWNGRPLVHASPNLIWMKANDPQVPEVDRRDLLAILRFFTFRPLQAAYAKGPVAPNQWCWLECFPQHAYGVKDDGRPEMCGAGVAQNHSWRRESGGRGLAAMNDTNVFGRAYMGPSAAELRPGESLYYGEDRNPRKGEPNRFRWGDNFAQQLAWARKLDPDYLFITGWNEFVAGYNTKWMGRPGAFPDQYAPEFSRDIEPSAGVLRDHFYYQFVDGVRAYRGVRPQRAAAAGPIFRDARLDTLPRDADGYGKLHYTDRTGRNDITDCFVEGDGQTLRFRVACAAPISSWRDPAWMRLFISLRLQAEDPTPNWHHFHFVVNRRSPPDARTAILEVCTGGWAWREVARVPMKINGAELEIAIPREAIAQSGRADLRFKWADNTPGPGGDGEILDFYRHGDVAPDGRFLYHYYE